MPPRMNARQFFWAGAVLTVIGIVLAIFVDQWVAQLVNPVDLAYGTAATLASLVRQVCMTLGLVLLGISPLARIIESRILEKPS